VQPGKRLSSSIVQDFSGHSILVTDLVTFIRQEGEAENPDLKTHKNAHDNIPIITFIELYYDGYQ
jgi:hypothetical protein